MVSIFVLCLTVEVHDCFWLPEQVDGAVGPGGSYVGSHLEDVTHVFHSHRNTVQEPMHDRCGDTIERTAALQNLLQGADMIEQCGRNCGERGQESARHPDFPSPLPPGPSLLLIYYAKRSFSETFWKLRRAGIYPLSSFVLDLGSALACDFSAPEARGRCGCSSDFSLSLPTRTQGLKYSSISLGFIIFLRLRIFPCPVALTDW